MDAKPVLEVNKIAKRFGGIRAVREVSFAVEAGDVLGVIGPNGSGKTTMINLLCGAYRVDQGSVRLGGIECAGKPAHSLAALGMGRTFQNPHVFKTLTVRQNMTMSVAHRADKASLRRLSGDVERWIEVVGLGTLADRVANELSGGQQKLVEFARVMVHQPKLVLMDEPFAGVHPQVKATLHSQIRAVANTGATSFLIVSHEVPDLVTLSNRFVCMANGVVLAAGSPDEVCANPDVIDSYLGAPLEPTG